MMEDTKINIDQLVNSFLSLTEDKPELLDEMLIDEGYNPQQLELKGITKIKNLLFREQVKLKKLQQESLYTKAIALFEGAKAGTREMILSLLQEKSPQLQFRNLEKLDEKNLREILSETDILDLMDKIENNY